MSDSNNGAHTPRFSGEDAADISDTESASSYAGSGAPDTPACPYQNADFFGQECSRYHDCPTHMIERSPEEHNIVSSVEGETGSQPAQTEATSPPVNNTTEDATNREESSNQQNQEDTSSSEHTLTYDMRRLRVEPSSSSAEQSASTSPPISHNGQGPPGLDDRISLAQFLGQSAPSPPSEPSSGYTSYVQSGSGLGGALAPSEASSSLLSSRLSGRPPRLQAGISLPRWQPDSEVTYCPICRTQFSFFVRKHHCRKCGRVVCSSCSPHRITIPHQFIVRPPGERPYARYSWLGDEGSIADFSALGGGEQVRLCNPCVPDPNTTPPQAQNPAGQFSPRSPHQRSQSSSSSTYNGENNNSRYLSFMSSQMPSDAYSRGRSVTMHSGPGHSQLPSNFAFLPPQGRIMTGTPPAYHPQQYPGYRHSYLNRRVLDTALSDYATASSSNSNTPRNRPLPPPPQIAEEDECPICHRELPSRELPNFEARRESHINSCITAHSTYSPAPGSGNHNTPPRTVRRTGMFPYLATEKDCVDSAECTICLEEFEVGVPMARLECLCRFHRSCITAWFVEHPGRCPVHQHDSFGY
ncbi:hypothetical protein M426DRAFT_325948 [Hypoxylon sp. CI-4A]|nr:hypothetical protein M426DRAFT_325948 [Hypoxylon sp. CI-4A]